MFSLSALTRVHITISIYSSLQ
uniref:Uncharacterized protein n=1 Tax=Arundo donax TaxID=35708 RepID=A0A0A9AUK2_ARUDO